jgi:hypothetical protein
MLQLNAVGIVSIIAIFVGLFLCCGWSLRGGPKASRLTRTSPGPDEDCSSGALVQFQIFTQIRKGKRTADKKFSKKNFPKE